MKTTIDLPDDLLVEAKKRAAERRTTIRALVDPTLKVEDDDLSGNNPVKSNPKGLTKGYNPYNSGALGKAEWKKKKNLHELSKWIELRKKMQQKAKPEGGEGNDEGA